MLQPFNANCDFFFFLDAFFSTNLPMSLCPKTINAKIIAVWLKLHQITVGVISSVSAGVKLK